MKPTYNEERADNIEILFNTLFYAQLLEDYDTTELQERLENEFTQFPVEFDKEQKASRFSNPYRYHESGLVTMSGNHDTSIEQVMLFHWEPENRPQPKDEKPKRKINRKTNYSNLLNIQPIWFLQLMQYEKRKTVAHHVHRSPIGHLGGINTVMNYTSVYQTNQLLKAELPSEDIPSFFTANKDAIDAAIFDQTVTNLWNRHIGHPNFFFLTDLELETLGLAIKQAESKYFDTYNTALETLRRIASKPTPERKYINTKPLEALTRTIKAENPQYGGSHTPFDMEITDHETAWRKLHDEYIGLTNNQLNVLRELHLVDDELLAQRQNEQEVLRNEKSDTRV